MIKRRLGMVMDPIEKIKPWKDSSFAMMLEAQSRGWQIFYMRIDDLYMENSISYATYQTVEVTDDNDDWFR
ncbi:MAG: glutathione synthase, partial [Gammaproteobacteria bacterium]